MIWLDSLVEMFFPRYCKVCGRRLCQGEEHLCVSCFIDMPRLKFGSSDFNITEQKLLSEPSISKAESMIRYYKESDYSNILYHLKYYNHPDVGEYLARIAAADLLKTDFFEGIDYIVPVPLSEKKMKKRGYNQCSFIASGIATVTGLPILDNVISRSVSNEQQAGKGRFQRWENAEGIFEVTSPSLLKEKHILIVDDVITTGATIASMAYVMATAAPGLRISVFTLAIAI
jgi:ComF family protein